MILLKVIKEGIKELIKGERALAQIESEYVAMMQGIVYEFAGEIMATCFHLEKIESKKLKLSA